MKKGITVAEVFCFYVITIVFIFFGFIVYKAYTTQFALPPEINQIVIVLVGAISGILGYMIGSTSSSKSKDDTINKALDSVPPAYVAKTNTQSSTVFPNGEVNPLAPRS